MSLSYLIPVVKQINAASLSSLVKVWSDSPAHLIAIAETIPQRSDRGANRVLSTYAAIQAAKYVKGGAA